MYYKEKFENGKWWVQVTTNGKWFEFSNKAYKGKAIELAESKFNIGVFDCSKYNKREGQGCDLNNNCIYPNCIKGSPRPEQ